MQTLYINMNSRQTPLDATPSDEVSNRSQYSGNWEVGSVFQLCSSERWRTVVDSCKSRSWGKCRAGPTNVCFQREGVDTKPDSKPHPTMCIRMWGFHEGRWGNGCHISLLLILLTPHVFAEHCKAKQTHMEGNAYIPDRAWALSTWVPT